MAKSKGYLTSLFGYSCPRCREGSLFISPFQLSNPLNMPARCPSCALKYESEPGFFWGAMFLSYILSAFILLAVSLLLMFGFKWSATSSVLAAVALAALMFLKLARFSRSLWIHLIVPYDKDAIDTSSNEA